MGKVVVPMSVSLDGFIEGPNGELDWQSIDAQLHRHFNDHLRTMRAFLQGRVMYELMAQAWPHADEDPAAPPEIVDYAGIWRDMPKIVYSRTLSAAGWHTTIVPDVVAEEVRALTADGDVAVGGAGLVESFLRLGLIDEFWIYVHPVAIGAGKPLFPAGAPISLRLVSTKAFDNGVVLLRYER